MKLPLLPYGSGRYTSRVQTVFGGLDRRAGAGEGTLAEAENLSGRQFPLLSVRPARGIVAAVTSPGVLSSHGEKLCWLSGTDFIYDGTVKGTVSAGSHRLVCMGKWILILPEMKVYDVEADTFGTLAASWSGSGGTVTVQTERSSLSCPNAGWDTLFREGDAVSIRGCTGHTDNNVTHAILRGVSAGELQFDPGVLTLPVGAEDSYTESGSLTVSRQVPSLEGACVCDNRLWGYAGNTIYASKLGDPRNFHVFDGLTTDAWQSETLDGSGFTGCICYLGYPVFFKENAIFKVYGDRPSNFQWSGNPFLGIAGDGVSDRSAVVVNNTVYYLSAAGIAAYSGSRPVILSAPLGETHWRNAVAGTDGLRYYVSMRDGTAYHLFVYDTVQGLWHREDGFQASGFARPEGGGLYMLGTLPGGTTGTLFSVDGTAGTAEPAVAWSAEFADSTEFTRTTGGSSHNRKGLLRLQLRTELETDAAMTVQVQYDSDGVWHTVKTLSAETKQSSLIPLVLRRCDHFRLRLSGTGGARVYSLAVTRYGGSEK